jgi:hypothetical protein
VYGDISSPLLVHLKLLIHPFSGLITLLLVVEVVEEDLPAPASTVEVEGVEDLYLLFILHQQLQRQFQKRILGILDTQ